MAPFIPAVVSGKRVNRQQLWSYYTRLKKPSLEDWVLVTQLLLYIIFLVTIGQRLGSHVLLMMIPVAGFSLVQFFRGKPRLHWLTCALILGGFTLFAFGQYDPWGFMMMIAAISSVPILYRPRPNCGQ